jgi:hypothetical protein
VTETLSRKNTHLIMKKGSNPQSAKYVKAKSWNIPIITEQWLHECVRQKGQVPWAIFSLEGPPPLESIASSPSHTKLTKTLKFETIDDFSSQGERFLNSIND